MYLPHSIPSIPQREWERMQGMAFADMAALLSQLWVGDEYDTSFIEEAMHAVYTWEVPLRQVGDVVVVELFHGPTASFKDFAAQWMGKMLPRALGGEPAVILVATSGDTGSAAAAGFWRSEGISVVVLYPSGGVSPIQERQITTFGENVYALEIEGSFDDCQRIVKEAFSDPELTSRVPLTSANSINVGRLVPQSFYYVWAYVMGAEAHAPIQVCVPSGNMGNMTGCIFARQMGVPVRRLVAAVNENAVFPEYLATGEFSPRSAVATLSNAMDIGNPSNVERIRALYRNDVSSIQKDVWSVSVSDAETKRAVRDVYNAYGYLMDPHTAVGWRAIQRYRDETGSKEPFFLVSTAHPAKFPNAMRQAVGNAASLPIPPSLACVCEKKKQSIRMPAAYAEVKQFLQDTFAVF